MCVCVLFSDGALSPRLLIERELKCRCMSRDVNAHDQSDDGCVFILQ